jgi:acetyl esterase
VTVVGRTNLERGKPVTVLVGWGPGGRPRNVLIEREDGSRDIRPQPHYPVVTSAI